MIAAETLENYKRCNNSFIQGIFQAQYRSSLSCSRCRTQSNTFDPFQCISVQLPQFHKHSVYITVSDYDLSEHLLELPEDVVSFFIGRLLFRWSTRRSNHARSR